jgi:hypothetical protein
LPGIKCDVCGNSWGGNRSLPFDCPEKFQRDKLLRAHWPIPQEQHKALQKELLAALRKQGSDINELNPGDDFQPGYLDVPSKPRADFLWCGIGTVVVSKRIKEFFESEKLADIQFSEVHLRKIGQREPWRRPPIPSIGEPEDLINEVPLADQNKPIGPYFELFVLSQSKRLPGFEPMAVCSGCGWKTFPDRPSELIMPLATWHGAEIFYVAGSRYIAVTENLKHKLQTLRPTNIQFRKLPQEYSGVVSLEEIALKGTPAERELAALLLEDKSDRKRLAKALADQQNQPYFKGKRN